MYMCIFSPEDTIVLQIYRKLTRTYWQYSAMPSTYKDIFAHHAVNLDALPTDNNMLGYVCFLLFNGACKK